MTITVPGTDHSTEIPNAWLVGMTRGGSTYPEAIRHWLRQETLAAQAENERAEDA